MNEINKVNLNFFIFSKTEVSSRRNQELKEIITDKLI